MAQYSIGADTLGGWKDVLLRLPGAVAGVQRFARVPQRVVLMDMPHELLVPPAEDVYDFPEPEAQQRVTKGKFVE